MMQPLFCRVRVIPLIFMALLLVACKDESLIGTLEVKEPFIYIDAEKIERPVTPGSYTAYLKPERSGDSLQSPYRLTLVEKNKAAEETQIIRIPIHIPVNSKWVLADAGEVDLIPAVAGKEPAAIAGSAYVPGNQLKQPFNIELSANHRDYKDKVSTKKDCNVSVASLKSDVGFAYRYYYDGFFLRPYGVSGPLHSMSLEFKAQPSYKKVSYTEAGTEYQYGLIIKSIETQKPLAIGSAVLRVPSERSKVREFTCRPM